MFTDDMAESPYDVFAQEIEELETYYREEFGVELDVQVVSFKVYEGREALVSLTIDGVEMGEFWDLDPVSDFIDRFIEQN